MGQQKLCPMDGEPLEEVGDCGIVDYDGNWDAQSTRFDCPNGHTVLVIKTESVIEPGEPAFEYAEQAIVDALREAFWVIDKYVRLKSNLLGKETYDDPITSLENLRSELAKRAVEAFRDEADENPEGHNYENAEYEFIHAMEDVDDILEDEEFKTKLEEMGWLKPK